MQKRYFLPLVVSSLFATAFVDRVQASSGYTVKNSIGMTLAYVEAGDFVMGDAEGERDEKPHHVKLTTPYFIGTCEVTNSQWLAVMGSAPTRSEEPDHPVDSIDWEQAVAFCDKLSALPGEKAQGNRYRLPTEAEWEYACRAGTSTKWFFGDTRENYGEYAWFASNSGGHSHPSGLKKPNQWGLFDMYGNVKEWCNDNYAPYFGASTTDPTGSDKGPKVVRGGGWLTREETRSADRNAADKKRRYPILGFRVVLEVTKSNAPGNPLAVVKNGGVGDAIDAPVTEAAPCGAAQYESREHLVTVTEFPATTRTFTAEPKLAAKYDYSVCCSPKQPSHCSRHSWGSSPNSPPSARYGFGIRYDRRGMVHLRVQPRIKSAICFCACRSR
jgi:formylglycine-generating enzyme required for sulfatase activity